jgi:hypothetical protein
MKQTLVRYKTKPERAQENAQLIAQVFAELKAKAPGGVRYLCLKLDDGTFVHFAACNETKVSRGREFAPDDDRVVVPGTCACSGHRTVPDRRGNY